MHAASKRLIIGTRDAQLRRAVRNVCNWLNRYEVQKSFVSSSSTSFIWGRSSCARKNTMDCSKTSQYVRDEKGGLLRDKGCIREIWVRFFHSLLNTKSDMLDPDIPKILPQEPIASALGIEPSEEESSVAIGAMANAKAVAPDGSRVEI